MTYPSRAALLMAVAVLAALTGACTSNSNVAPTEVATPPTTTTTTEPIGTPLPAPTATTGAVSPTATPVATGNAALPTWLRVNGFGPVDFGAGEDETIAAVASVFGPVIDTNAIDECPGGSTFFFNYEDFTLSVSEGRFTGWLYRSSAPALTTPSGVTIGTSRTDLAAIYDGVSIDITTLGEEFFYEVPAGYIGGFMSEDGETVTELYAGIQCFFR